MQGKLDCAHNYTILKTHYNGKSYIQPTALEKQKRKSSLGLGLLSEENMKNIGPESFPEGSLQKDDSTVEGQQE